MATTTKPQLPHLKTPLSASFPSEMRSPCVGTPTYIKQEDSQKTPITPPAAYLDFLSKLSPTLMTPLPTGTSFTFSKPALTSVPSTESVATISSASTSDSSTSTAPASSSRPASPRTKSSRSSSLSSSNASSEGANISKKRPESTVEPPTGRVIPPPSPFARPLSARTPRRLHIPQSPYSPASVRSPLSAASIYSPYSAAWSPRDPNDPDKTKTTHVSVRQVVTRTVTHYARTPIVDPVPASKRRKIEPSNEERKS